MKNIEMISFSNCEGIIRPIKFRWFEDGQEAKIIKIDRILDRREEKLAGNRMIVFRAQSIIDNTEKIFEMKYEINTCKWYLYKM